MLRSETPGDKSRGSIWSNRRKQKPVTFSFLQGPELQCANSSNTTKNIWNTGLIYESFKFSHPNASGRKSSPREGKWCEISHDHLVTAGPRMAASRPWVSLSFSALYYIPNGTFGVGVGCLCVSSISWCLANAILRYKVWESRCETSGVDDNQFSCWLVPELLNVGRYWYVHPEKGPGHWCDAVDSSIPKQEVSWFSWQPQITALE